MGEKGRRDRPPLELPSWPRRLPPSDLPGPTAALLTGAVIGVLAVLATYGSLRLCDLATGTPSCGRPGLLLLAALLIALAYLGGGLLRRFGVEAPGSTSILAVGLLAVVAMLFLIDVLFAWWMVLVIPPVSMATYALAWWVTNTAAETE